MYYFPEFGSQFPESDSENTDLHASVGTSNSAVCATLQPMNSNSFESIEQTASEFGGDPDFNDYLDVLNDSNEFLSVLVEPQDANGVAVDNEVAAGVEEGAHGDYAQPIALHIPAAPKAKKPRLTIEQRLVQRREACPMRPACGPACRKKCSTLISEAQRQRIWEEFWSLSGDFVQRQRDFITNAVKQLWKKSATVLEEDEDGDLVDVSQRSFTFAYHLLGEVVCKAMFESTLGFKYGNEVRTVMEANRVTPNAGAVGAAGDLRGKGKNPSTFPPEYAKYIADFVEKYRPLSGHYNREHAPHRRYLAPHLTVARLYDDFCVQAAAEGQRVCRKRHFEIEFAKLNIGFTVPSVDRCTTCVEHNEQHLKVMAGASTHDVSDCEKCLANRLHCELAEVCRAAMDADTLKFATNPRVWVFFGDLQKALPLPMLDFKDAFFSQKLVFFNVTFAETGDGGRSWAICWHEGAAGRNGNNIASAMLHFVVTAARDAETIIIWLDNCVAQNRNRVCFAMMILAVNDPACNAKSIFFKYLEPGHTQNAADSVHGNIGTELKHRKIVYDFDDMCQVIRDCRRKQKVVVEAIDQSKMYIIGEQHLRKKLPIKFADVKIAEFRRGNLEVFLRKDFEENSVVVSAHVLSALAEQEIRRRMRRSASFIEKLNTEDVRGVSRQKYDALQKLCAGIPLNRQHFFRQLKVNDDAADLEVEPGLDRFGLEEEVPE